MARTDTLQHYLSDVADAIKLKKGSSGSILASDFDTEIINLPSSGGGSDFPKFTQESSEEIINLYLTTEGITQEDIELIQSDIFDTYDDIAFTINTMIETPYEELESMVSTLNAAHIDILARTFDSINADHIEDETELTNGITFINNDGEQIRFLPVSENSIEIYVGNGITSPMYVYDLIIETESEDISVILDYHTEFITEDMVLYYTFHGDNEPDPPYEMFVPRIDILWDTDYANTIQATIDDCLTYYDVQLINLLTGFAEHGSADINDYVSEFTEDETVGLSMLLDTLYYIYPGKVHLIFDDLDKMIAIEPISSTSAVFYNYNDNTDLYSYTVNVPSVPEPEEYILNEVKTMYDTFTDIGPIYFEKIGHIITVSCDVTNGLATDTLKVNELTITIGNETFQFANGEEILASETMCIGNATSTDTTILEEEDFTIDEFSASDIGEPEQIEE